MPRPFGVYVHFPYCTLRCPYCDFAVSTERNVSGARYRRAILTELRLRAEPFLGLGCRSLYLGGGTPSLWEPEEVAEVVAEVRRRFALPAAAEVTLEANPESCRRDRLAAYRDAGVNRFSIGVQSFDRAVLAKLGRRHGPEVAEAAIRAAAEVVENVSIDLIYGARRSTPETATADATWAAALPVTHISAYALTLDPDVLAEEVPLARLRRQGRLVLPSDGEVLAQARALRRVLRRAGFERYEISNFARRGFASVHNALYWAGESYLGLGAGAYGCHHAGAAAIRYANPRAPGAWLSALESERLPPVEEERLSPAQVRNERVMLALRTTGGLPLRELSERQRAEADRLVRARLAARREEALVLTSRGMDLHSAIAERLFE